MLAPSERDHLGALPIEPDEVARAVAATFARFGFELVEGRRASTAEIAATRSTWAKRLLTNGAWHDRPVTLVRLRKSGR